MAIKWWLHIVFWEASANSQDPWLHSDPWSQGEKCGTGMVLRLVTIEKRDLSCNIGDEEFVLWASYVKAAVVTKHGKLGNPMDA